jgi:hypothetical protein
MPTVIAKTLTLGEIVARAPWSPGTTRTWAPRLARKIRNHSRYDIQSAYDAMVASLGAELNRKRESEIRRAIERVYNDQLTGGTSCPRTEPLAYDPKLLEEQAEQVSATFTSDWLVEHSPVNVAHVSPAQFLDAIFQPFELAAVKICETDPWHAIQRKHRAELC